MQKTTENYCINFPKHQEIKIKHKNNREQDDGICKQETEHGFPSWQAKSI